MPKLPRLSLFIALLAAPAVAAPATTRLFSLDEAKHICTGKVRELGTPNERALFEAKTCPTQVLLDPAGKRVIVVEGSSVRAHALTDGKATELGKLPVADASVWLEESGKLRASWLVLDKVDVKTVKEATVFRFEGKDHPVTADDALPPWGTPAMAILAELDGTSWKRLEARPTKTEAGDTPGVGALQTPRAPKKGVIAVADLLAKMTCVGGVLDCAASAAVTKRIAKEAKDADGAGTVALGKGTLAFAVMVGDTPHAFPPVLLCTDAACAKSVVVEAKGKEQRQLGLAVQGGYAIVSEEYSSANAKVIDANGKVVLALPSSTAVVFLPDGVALK